MASAVEKYQVRVEAVNSLVCIGLDSDLPKLPLHFRNEKNPQFAFNRWIIEQTHEFVSAYKPNLAFYEAQGEAGWHELTLTISYLKEHHPDILTIGDGKRADIDSTNRGYVRALFDSLDLDAVTLNPYLGRAALLPFLERQDKGCIILCRTSNEGADEFQDLNIHHKPLWQHVAEHVRDSWNQHGNCMLVIGATQPEVFGQIRAIVNDMTLLVPGVGTQGGNLETVVRYGVNREKAGLIINAARSVIFTDNPRNASKTLRDEINRYRE